MKRRQFLASITAGLLCTLGLGSARTPTATAMTRDTYLSSKSIEAEIQMLFSNIESAKTVGRRYLELFPNHADRTFLLDKSGLSIFQRYPSTKKTLLKSALDQQRRQEFFDGDTIILDGWILARSEVCLCALLALS